MTRSLVLDAATWISGFCIVEDNPAHEIAPGYPGRKIADGIIKSGKGKDNLIVRMGIFKADVLELVKAYKIDEIVIEYVIFKQPSAATNQAMAAVHLRCREIAHEFGIPFYTINTKTIKKGVTGDGNADKDKVQDCVCYYYRITKSKIKDDNHSDALAAAFVWLLLAKEIREKAKAKKKGK